MILTHYSQFRHAFRKSREQGGCLGPEQSLLPPLPGRTALSCCPPQGWLTQPATAPRLQLEPRCASPSERPHGALAPPTPQLASPVLYHLFDGIRRSLDDLAGRDAVHHSFIQPPDHAGHRHRDRSGARPAARPKGPGGEGGGAEQRREAKKWRPPQGLEMVEGNSRAPRTFAPSGSTPRNWVR